MSLGATIAMLRQSPVVDREKLVRARSGRTPVTMALNVCVLGGFALVMFGLAISRAADNRPSAVDMAQVAFLTAAVQLVLALLFVPPLAATAISGERERGTFDLLVLGRLSPTHIVVTKLAATLAYLALVMVMALPVLVAVFLYAGLDLGQLLLVEVVTVVTVATLAAVGVLVGTWLRRALTATLVAYVVGVVLYAGTALLGVVVRFDAPLNPERAESSTVHPVVFANPFYAIHAVVLGPSPSGAHVGHLGESLALKRDGASTWGPVVQPWQASVTAQAAIVVIGLWLAKQALGGRSLVPRWLVTPLGRKSDEPGGRAEPIES